MQLRALLNTAYLSSKSKWIAEGILRSAAWKRRVLFTLEWVHTFLRLSALYGWRKSFQLHKIAKTCRKTRSPIDSRLRQLANQMANGSHVPGSATRRGWLYHDFPLPEFGLPTHRKNSASRIRKLSQHLPLYKAKVLDIGCSSGGISLGLALLGASKVIGVDHDPVAIMLARTVAEKYDIHCAQFEVSKIEDFQPPQADILLWLSQWMWTVKEHGLEYSKDLLFEIPARSGAIFMVFESAANDGKAAIPGATQDDLFEYLKSSTPFQKIRGIGPFEDKWRQAGQERTVFLCSEPCIEWQGKAGKIRRINRSSVRKEYAQDFIWSKDIEALCLRRLASYPFFPTLIDEGDDWLELEWGGYRANKAADLEQLDAIVLLLAKNDIVHRDICPENILYQNGRLSLIDFGWAVVDGREPPVTPPKGLGRGFYRYGEWDDRQAAKKVRSWFEKQ